MKRIFAVLALIFVMSGLVVSLSSCDKEEITSKGLRFSLNEDRESYTLVGIGTCDDEHIIIDTHRKKPITDIADGVFSGIDEIRSVTLGDSVKRIGKYAFAECASLESVSLGNSVETIEPNAFYNCTALSNVDFSDSLKSIGAYAFEYCKSLEVLNFGKSLSEIGNHAFYGCYSLRDIYFNDELKTIGKSAFTNCNKLESIKFGRGLENIGDEAFSGCSSIENLNFAPAAVIIGNSAFKQCTSLRSLTLPEGALSVGYSAFANCRELASINLSSTLLNIDNYAFSNCKALKEIEVPSNVLRIGPYAFYECSSLESLTVPFVGNSANVSGSHIGNIFGSSTAENVPESLKNLTVTSVKEIPSYSLSDCTSLENVILGDGVSTVGAYAFSGCVSLRSVTLSDTVTKMGSYVFKGCVSLAKLDFGTGIRSIGTSSFLDTVSLGEVHISNLKSWCTMSISNIYASPFCYNASLYIDGERVRELAVPNDVKSISGNVFYGANVTDIVLHDNIDSVGANAFSACPNLRYNEYGGVQYLGNENNPYLLLVGVIDRTVSNIRIHENTKIIGRSAFSDCTNLTNIALPDSVETVGNYAFLNCSSLLSIAFGSGVRSIGYQAFGGCEALGLAVFYEYEGWRVSESSGMSNAKDIDGALLSDASAAAGQLSSEYLSYYWKRTIK